VNRAFHGILGRILIAEMSLQRPVERALTRINSQLSPPPALRPRLIELTAVKVPDCRSGLASDVAIGAQQRARLTNAVAAPATAWRGSNHDA
jgi:hypothetical protein